MWRSTQKWLHAALRWITISVRCHVRCEWGGRSVWNAFQKIQLGSEVWIKWMKPWMQRWSARSMPLTSECSACARLKKFWGLLSNGSLAFSEFSFMQRHHFVAGTDQHPWHFSESRIPEESGSSVAASLHASHFTESCFETKVLFAESCFTSKVEWKNSVQKAASLQLV